MCIQSRVQVIERRRDTGATCRCRVEVIDADKVPTAPPLPARCKDCGGEPLRVIIRRADPSVNFTPERW